MKGMRVGKEGLDCCSKRVLQVYIRADTLVKQGLKPGDLATDREAREVQ